MGCKGEWRYKNVNFLKVILKFLLFLDVSFFRMKIKNGLIIKLVVYIITLFFTIFIGYSIIFGKGGIMDRKGLEKEIELLRKEIEELENEKGKIGWKIENLQSNKAFVEGFARELGFKKDGEIIFKYIKNSDGKQD